MLELSPPEDDGLLIEQVGDWAGDKHHFLLRYIDAFTEAMKDKSWSALHYVDLFAGPGILRLKSSGKLEWGSPLIAAQVPRPRAFDGIHLCERNPDKLVALKKRLDRTGAASKVRCLEGDANTRVDEIVSQLPHDGLILAFLDPYGLHLDFETLRVLADRRCDLIIFFPDHLDALRNCEFVYRDNPNSNLDRVLGTGVDWRSALEKAPRDGWADVLRKLYVSRIETLHYKYFDYERISLQNRPLYRLIFCSRHKVGAKIWRGISQTKPNGQRTIDFPD